MSNTIEPLSDRSSKSHLRRTALPTILGANLLHTTDSKYVDRKGYLSRYSHERMVAVRESCSEPIHEFGTEEEWSRCLRDDLTRFVPFLMKKCGIEFSGRVLEIGAGGAWLSAEISKLPKVVEVVTTDFSPKLLKEQAPKVFKLLKAHGGKITRTPGDFHKLDFPSNHFDFVVGSAVLQHATNVVQVLREAKRVLKPGGRFVAIREPVWPLVKLKSRVKKAAAKAGPGGLAPHHYTLRHYKEFFKQAALPLEVKRVILSRGFKYYFDKMVNGLTHARFAFIGSKRAKS
jgi:ubiquinone/menaquinone biosynthesis C-methylase UbiE